MRATRTGLHLLTWCLAGVPAMAQAQAPTSVVLPVSESACNQELLTRVNLNGPAPAGGLVIQLTSSISNAVAVPGTVTAAAGANFATFTLTCTPAIQALAVTITATASGTSQSAVLNVLAPVLSTLSCKPVTGSTDQDCSAGLLGKAPASGVIVTLSNSSPNLAAVPPSVTVAAGSSSSHFNITNILPVSQPTTITITATGLGVSRTVAIALKPATPTNITFQVGANLTAPTASVVSGNRQTATVTVSGPAGQGGLPVQLTSSQPAIAAVPASVTVPAAQTNTTFAINTVASSQTTPVTITATVGTVSKSVTITVTGTTIQDFGVAKGTVVGGQTATGRLFPDNPPGPGGLTVQLVSNNPAVALVPPTFTIPAGADLATFNIATFPLESSRTVTITATSGSTSRSVQLIVVPEGPTEFTITPGKARGGVSVIGKLQALASDDAFVVQLTSADTSVLTVPASVSFAANETVKTFTISSKPVASETRVSVVARTTNSKPKSTSSAVTSISSGGNVTVTLTSAVDIVPPSITGFTLSPGSVVGGSNTTITGTVTLDGPVAAGFRVTVSDNNPSALRSVSGVSFPKGSSVGTFQILTAQVPVDGSVTISVSAVNGGTRSATLQIRR